MTRRGERTGKNTLMMSRWGGLAFIIKGIFQQFKGRSLVAFVKHM